MGEDPSEIPLMDPREPVVQTQLGFVEWQKMNDLLSRLGTLDNLTYLLRELLTWTLLWVNNYIQLNWNSPTTLATQYGHMNKRLVKSNT